MRVVCQHCKKAYNIPDEKLPSGKKISFPCPACTGLIKLDLRSTLDPINKSAPFMKLKPGRTSKMSSESGYTKNQPAGIALRYGILKTMGELPPMPQVVSKAQEILANPDSSLVQLANVVEMDPALASKILKLANSAYYGLSGKVSSVQHASVLLGYKVLGELIVMAGISSFMDKTLKGYDLESGCLWRHSITVAIGSKIIANKFKPKLEPEVFFAGLIHDIGKLILDRYIDERKEEFKIVLNGSDKPFFLAEREILGFDHSEMGSDFCEKWNIPTFQSHAIKFHHNPSGGNGNDLAYILHIADAIAGISENGEIKDMEHLSIEDGALEFLGIRENRLHEIMDEIIESANKIEEEMQ